jgi:5-methylcytosine-specific restriction endonuclease McrA
MSFDYGTKRWAQFAEQVKARDGRRCVVAGCPSRGRLFADHIIEVEDGGPPWDIANAQTLCSRHHNLKTAGERYRRESRGEPVSPNA